MLLCSCVCDAVAEERQARVKEVTNVNALRVLMEQRLKSAGLLHKKEVERSEQLTLQLQWLAARVPCGPSAPSETATSRVSRRC